MVSVKRREEGSGLARHAAGVRPEEEVPAHPGDSRRTVRDYGPTFAAEIQLYAAAGYVVLYVNPRGSTGYGEAFAQAINGNYPGPDYDDLMAVWTRR